MKRMMSAALLTIACGVPGVTAAQAQGQGLPTSQPSLNTIIREDPTTRASTTARRP